MARKPSKPLTSSPRNPPASKPKPPTSNASQNPNSATASGAPGVKPPSPWNDPNFLLASGNLGLQFGGLITNSVFQNRSLDSFTALSANNPMLLYAAAGIAVLLLLK